MRVLVFVVGWCRRRDAVREREGRIAIVRMLVGRVFLFRLVI